MAQESQQVIGSLAELTSSIQAAQGFAEVVKSLRSGNSAAIDGAWGSSCALTVAALSGSSPQDTLLVVLPGIRDIEEFFDQLTEFIAPDAEIRTFPAWETLPDEHDVTDSVFAARLAAVRFLNENQAQKPSSPDPKTTSTDPWSFSVDTVTPDQSTASDNVRKASAPRLIVTCLAALLQPVPSRKDI